MALEPNQVGVNEFTDLCKWGRCADDGGKSGYPWGLGGRGPAAILQGGWGDFWSDLPLERLDLLFTE